MLGDALKDLCLYMQVKEGHLRAVENVLKQPTKGTCITLCVCVFVDLF